MPGLYQPLCKICQFNAEHEDLADMLLEKKSGEEVRRILESEYSFHTTKSSIHTHKLKHMTVTKMTQRSIVEAQAESKQVDVKYDEGKIEPQDKIATLSYLIDKSIKLIRQLESVPSQQMSHQAIKGYMMEVRECTKLLANLQGETASEGQVNVQVVNMDVITVMRAVADVVREMFPDREYEFIDALKKKVSTVQTRAIDVKNIKPSPGGSIEVVDDTE